MYAVCPCVELCASSSTRSRPIEGNTVNELIDSQTLLLKEYTWMARAVYKCSRQDPEDTYG
jgi:hypothetical protein